MLQESGGNQDHQGGYNCDGGDDSGDSDDGNGGDVGYGGDGEPRFPHAMDVRGCVLGGKRGNEGVNGTVGKKGGYGARDGGCLQQ